MLKPLLALFLLLNCACCTEVAPSSCPKRQAFNGTTWDDLGQYCGELERIYDACAGNSK